MHPDDQELTRDMVRRSTEQKTGWQGVAIRWLHKDGSVRHFESTAQPILDNQRKLTGFSGIDRDITVRKRAGEELQRYRDHLEKVVEERTAELIAFNEHLQQEIIERKQTEEKLRESESRHRSLFDGIPIGLYRTTLGGQFVDANPAFVKMLEYPDRESLLAVNAADNYVNPSDREEWQAALARDGIVPGYSMQLRRYDGTPIWIENSARIIYDDSGQVAYYEGAVQDITERRRAEVTLQASEERYRILFEHAPIGIALSIPSSQVMKLNDVFETIFTFNRTTDFRGSQVLMANDAFEQLYGYSREELDQMDPYDPYPNPEDRDQLINRLKQDGFVKNYEVARQRPDGTPYYVSTTVVPFPMAGEGALLVMEIDITVRKQAEQALRKSEERYRTLFENAPIGIGLSIIGGQVVMINDALQQMYGYSREELDQIDPYMSYQNPADRDRLLEHLKTDEFVRDFEVAIQRKDGTSYYASMTIIPFPMVGQDYVLTMMTDITHRKQAEDALKQSRDRLRLLSNRLAEVEETERRRLARELHDQVGTNLAALGINLNVAKAQLPAEGTDLVRARLEDALALVKSTTASIRSVMDDLRPSILDDYGLVVALRWYGEQFAARTTMDMTVHGDELRPRLAPSVENSLFRIVQEALTNAAKHAQAKQVTLRVQEHDETVRLTVADDGVGFDSTRPTEPGQRRGWGLFTMTERAEAIGGHCHIESSPGKGTQVIVEVYR
jgi:PAS domain S-box-containing protein